MMIHNFLSPPGDVLITYLPPGDVFQRRDGGHVYRRCGHPFRGGADHWPCAAHAHTLLQEGGLDIFSFLGSLFFI